MSDEVSADMLADRFNTVGADGTVAERAAADRSWAFGHLIVDEAQEHSAMMWRLLARRCPSRSMTVVGDVAQTGSVAGSDTWAQVLDPFAEGRWQLAELSVNYRTPREIMDVAADVLASFAPDRQPPSSVRDVGEYPRAVRWTRSPSRRRLARLIREARARRRHHCRAGARRHARSASPNPPIRCFATLALAGPDTANKLMLLEVRAAKGLEFDVVIVVDPQAILDASATRGQRPLRGADPRDHSGHRRASRSAAAHPVPTRENDELTGAVRVLVPTFLGRLW